MAFTAKAKAKFKTAYLQRELTIEIAPKDTVTAHVGEVYKVDSNGELERISASNADKSTAIANCKAAVAVGQYILAQSDMTVGYGHVPVENRDYKYKDEVAMTDSTSRKFVVFRINDLNDIEIDTDVSGS